MSVNPVPEGFHTVNAYLVVEDAARAIDFYREAFGAEELLRLPVHCPDGRERVGHAVLRIGDTRLMLSDEWPSMNTLGPNKRGGPTASFVLYGPDCDATFKRAIAAGAIEAKPVSQQFWGDRMGTVTDPFGHKWSLGTHVEDVLAEEMASRMQGSNKALAVQAPND